MRRAAVLGAMLLVASLVAAIPASAAKPRSLRVVKARGTDAPALVSGISARPESGPAPTVATDHLNENTARYGIADPQQELSPLEVVAHEGGRTVRFQQRHRGVPVFGAHYLVHLDDTDDGKRVTTVNGDFFTELEVAVEPRVSPADARTLALASIRPLRGGSAEDHGLVVLPVSDGVLAYHLTVQGEGLGAPLREQVFVDAVRGHVVLSYNDIKTAGPVEGTGDSVKDPDGEPLPLRVFERENGTYQLRTPAPAAIVTHDAGNLNGNTFDPDDASIVGSPESHFSGEDTDSGAVDAHWGAQEVFDFYETLGRNSLDGQGMPIVSVVNASDRGAPLYNAFWNGEHVTFGNPRPGPADGLYPLSAAPDIVAHEFNHGVNEFSADFVYLNQSGALDEAYADYFGNAVEVTAEGMQMTDPEASQIGEDVCKEDGATPRQWTCPFLRDLNEEDPGGNPRGTDDYLYYLYDFDNGGVHDNATIYAGALWEIRERLAQHPDFEPLLADRIIYRALTNHAPLDSFFDGRGLVETAAQEIGAAELSPQQREDVNDIVDRAFDDRGIDVTWDAGTGNDTLVLLDDTSPQGFTLSVPQVSGDTFVTVHRPNLAKSGKLFMGNVTGEGDPRKITGSQSNQFVADEQPDIGGGEIVWSRLTNSGGVDIDVIGTRNGPDSGLRTVAGSSAWEWYPSVDGNLVAWENLGRSQTDIYARYGTRRIRKLTRTAGNEFDPQVAGDTVAWWDRRRRVPRIQIKNLRTGRKATIKLSRPPSSAEIGPPALTSRYAFWFQDRNGDGRGAIKRSNHRGNKKKTLVSESSPFAPVWTSFVGGVPRPSANNSWVAYTTAAGYQAWFDGEPIASDGVGRDIFLVPTGGGTPKPVTCNRGDQAYPAVGRGQRAVWLDASRGQTDMVTWLSQPNATCG
jgi:Zn-dependent metalloprotease